MPVRPPPIRPKPASFHRYTVAASATIRGQYEHFEAIIATSAALATTHAAAAVGMEDASVTVGVYCCSAPTPQYLIANQAIVGDPVELP